MGIVFSSNVSGSSYMRSNGAMDNSKTRLSSKLLWCIFMCRKVHVNSLVLLLFVACICVILGWRSILGNFGSSDRDGNERRKSRDQVATTGDLGHAIMLDAGSGGTRLHLYQYQQTSILRSIAEVHNVKQNPGLSNCTMIARGGDSESILACSARMVHELLRNCSTTLREQYHGQVQLSEIPVYLRATAGLRLLSIGEQVKILEGARHAIFKEGYQPFIQDSDKPRVITGTEEALYDWLTVNVGSDLLHDNNGVSNHRKKKRETLGVLDLGGASTQIAFQLLDDAAKGPAITSMYLRGLGHFHLYAVSRLRYGLNEAFKEMTWIGTRSAAGGKDDHPCILKGATHVRAQGKKMDAFTGILHGSSSASFEDCLAAVRSFLATSERINVGGLALDDSGQQVTPTPPASMMFMAIDNFFKAAGNILWNPAFGIATPRLNRSSPYVDLRYFAAPTVDEIAARGREVCELSLDELQSHIVGMKASRLRNACFSAAFVVALLQDVYRFSPSERRILIANDVGRFDGSWAIGGIVYELLKEEHL